MISIAGSGGRSFQGDAIDITDTYVPVGARSFHVSGTGGLHVGVENLRGESDYDSNTDESHSWDFIRIAKAQHVWVRRTKARFFAYSHVNVRGDAKWVTIDDAPDVTVDVPLGIGGGDDIVLQAGETQRLRVTFAPARPALGDPTVHDFDLADGLVLLSDAANAPAFDVALRGASTFNSDITHDGGVGLEELGLLNANFGRTAADAAFDPTADISGDGVVNLVDLGRLKRRPRRS